MLREVIQLGEAREHRGILVAPLFPHRDPVAAYVTLDEALERGLRITEVDESGSVPELLVRNPLEERVLLYDGEELVGAKQNRILNVSVLAEAKTTLKIPVSCVEQGRWSRRSAAFAPATHAAPPRLRRDKNIVLHDAPLALGLAQREVWHSVQAQADRMGVRSPTVAAADTFHAHGRSLAELETAFPAEPGQCGALLTLEGSFCLDYVSRPDAFARIWPKLRRGYLLDALERLDRTTVSRAVLPTFLAGIDDAEQSRQHSVGLGEDLRLRGERVIGSGLELNGELLQLSAFTSEDGEGTAPGAIARPSRRR